MKFSIYGRFLLDIEREHGAWKTYRVADGRRVWVNDFVIPPEMNEEDIPQFLDDVFHELSGPEDRIVAVR